MSSAAQFVISFEVKQICIRLGQKPLQFMCINVGHTGVALGVGVCPETGVKLELELEQELELALESSAVHWSVDLCCMCWQ